MFPSHIKTSISSLNINYHYHNHNSRTLNFFQARYYDYSYLYEYKIFLLYFYKLVIIYNIINYYLPNLFLFFFNTFNFILIYPFIAPADMLSMNLFENITYNTSTGAMAIIRPAAILPKS